MASRFRELTPDKGWCEFQGHTDKVVANWQVIQYGEAWNACAEHAHALCDVCDKALENDHYILRNREVMCGGCDLADGYSGIDRD